MRNLVPCFVNSSRRPQQVVPGDLDRSHWVDLTAVPETQPRLEDRRAEPLVDVRQHDRRRLTDLIEDLRHAPVRQGVAGAKQRRRVFVRSRADRVGEIIQGRLGLQILPPKRQHLTPHRHEVVRRMRRPAHRAEHVGALAQSIDHALKVPTERKA